MEFASLGYMPVKQEAFAYLPEAIEKLVIRCMYHFTRLFRDTGELYILYSPSWIPYLDLETKFEELVPQILSVKRMSGWKTRKIWISLSGETLEDFKAAYTQ